jgi:erythromycin esterase
MLSDSIVRPGVPFHAWPKVRAARGRSPALAIVALAAICTGATPPRDAPCSQEEFVSWVRESAIHLEAEKWHVIDTTRLSDLDEALKGKRFVYLGEPDHGIREKYDYRLLFIRYLVQKGWRHIAVEAGFAGGKRLDRYLATGDPAHIEAHYERHLREGRETRAPGVPGARDPEFLAILRSEKTWFLQQLRAINEARPAGTERLHWFGFDLDSTPGGGYADAVALLQPHESNALIQNILQRLALVDGETQTQEVQRLRGLLEFLDSRQADLRDALGEADAREVRSSIECLANSYRFAIAREAGPDTPAWRRGMAKREQIMCRRLDEWIDGLPPADKVILLGHNFHLARKNTAIRVEGTAIGRQNIGTHLADRFPGQVCVIWMLYDRGRHLDAYSKPYVKEVPSHSGTIARVLAKAGTRFVLPLHSGDAGESYLHQPREFIANGEFRASAVLPEQADVLFFLSEATELRGR